MFTRTVGLILAVVATVALSSCGSSGSSSSTRSATVPTARVGAAPSQTAVEIKSFKFGPDPVTVTTGSTITWTNRDSAPHTATVKDGFDTGRIAKGKSASVTLDKAGTYSYFCAVHPDMTGTVIVQD